MIEPGFTQKQFATHGMQSSGEESPYHQDGLSWLSTYMKEGQTATPPSEVAKVVVNALFDQRRQLRYHAGKHSGSLLLLRKILPDSWFQTLVGKAVLRGKKPS